MKLKKYSEFSKEQKGWAFKGPPMCSKVKGTDTAKDWLFDENGWPQERIETEQISDYSKKISKEKWAEDRLNGKLRMQVEEVSKDLNDCINQKFKNRDALKRKLVRVMNWHIAEIENILKEVKQ